MCLLWLQHSLRTRQRQSMDVKATLMDLMKGMVDTRRSPRTMVVMIQAMQAMEETTEAVEEVEEVEEAEVEDIVVADMVAEVVGMVVAGMEDS